MEFLIDLVKSLYVINKLARHVIQLQNQIVIADEDAVCWLCCV